MKIGELIAKTEAIKNRFLLREVNAIYERRRNEFETTTVCTESGKVIYVRGAAPPVRVPYVVPEWKRRQMDAKVRSIEEAYRVR